MRKRGYRIAGFLLVVGLLIGFWSTVQPSEPGVRPSTVDDEIRQLHTPKGKLEYVAWMVPGGAWFHYSEPMNALIAHGNAIQPRLLAELDDSRIRNSVVVILSEIGDKDVLPFLIDRLPTTDALTNEQRDMTVCLLTALQRLTGTDLYTLDRFGLEYRVEFRTRWRKWYDGNRDYLYLPSSASPFDVGSRTRVAIDWEAKLAGVPTASYRELHPWVRFDEIETWRDDARYWKKLEDYCYAVILNEDWYDALGPLRNPRILPTIRARCRLPMSPYTADSLIRLLGDRDDPTLLPMIENFPRSNIDPSEGDWYAERRTRIISWLRSLEKMRREHSFVPHETDRFDAYARYLADAEDADQLVAEMRDRKNDWNIESLLQSAGYIDRAPVRSFLKEMIGDATRDDRTKALAHGALARLGEKSSVDTLRRSLNHSDSRVRLAAAECLWRMGMRDGFQTLIDLLALRSLESGREGVAVGESGFTVTALRGTKVEVIRRACKILGEMGDPRAIEPLANLQTVNLNGVSISGGSGTGWPGRPDIVARAKLGDYSGVPYLRESVHNYNRLDVVRTGGGDYLEIGLKKFIPDIFPELGHHDTYRRMTAAQNILLLLERGK
jgi:HEAT repeat protein